MANTTKAIPQKEEAREKGPETPDAPLLLLDLSGAAVKKNDQPQSSGPSTIHRGSGSAPFRVRPSPCRPLGFWRRRVVGPCGAGTTWIDQNLLLMMWSLHPSKTLARLTRDVQATGEISQLEHLIAQNHPRP
jgi:hypothetical protein